MRLLTVLITILMLSACGFTPVYGTKSVSNNLSNVEVAVIPDRSGQIVRNTLIDVLYSDGYPNQPEYNLIVSPIQETVVNIGIDRDDEASRAQLRQEATLQLIDIKTNKAVFKRTVRATTAYNILAGQFTTFVTEEDARNQTLKAISEDIITQLEIYFNK